MFTDTEQSQGISRLFLLTQDPIAIIDPQNRLQQVNPAWVQAFGDMQESVGFTAFTDLVHPDDVGTTRAMLAKVAEDKQATSFENRCQYLDGSYRRLHWDVTPDPEQALLFLVARKVDSQQQTAETQGTTQSTQLSELSSDPAKLLHFVVDTTSEWIFIKDRNYRYVMANQAFAYEYGRMTPEQMVGKDDYDLGTPAELIEGNPEKGIRGFRTDDREVMEQGKMLHNPYDPATFRDGTLHIFDSRKYPLRDASGNIIGVLGYARDVTEVYQAQEQIRKRAAELATVAEVSVASAQNLELATLLQNVSDLTKERFGLYHAHIYLLDEAGEHLVLAAGAGEAGRAMQAKGHQIALANQRSLVARAARTREGVIANDVTVEPDFLPNPLLPDTRSELAVPMIVGEEVIGVLDVQADMPDRFTDQDVLIKTTLAEQIAVAVQNARLFQRIEDSEKLLRSVIDTTSDWILVKDRNYRYVMANQAFAYEYGRMTPEQMVGKDDYDLGTPAELIEGNPEKGIRGFRTDDREVMEQGKMLHNPYDPATFRDGTLHIFDSRKYPLRDASGNIIGVLGYARDVTEVYQAQEQIRKRAAELATVAEVSVASAQNLELATLLQNVSDLTKERFGLYHAHIYLLDEAGEHLVLAAGAGEAGRAMQAKGHQIALANQRSLVARAARTREGVIANDVTVEPDFLPNPLLPDTRSELAVPMIVGEEVIGVLDVQADMPDRFTDQDVLIKTTLAEQIAVAVQNARLFQQQVETAEQLRSIDRLKTEFLANMSHELRTPLNSIIGYAEVLADGIDGELPEEALEDVNAIHTSGVHLLNMINDILDLAKIEAGKMELELEPVQLADVTDELRRATSVLLKDKPVAMVIDVPKELPALMASRVRLLQILNNLVSNAAKFTHEGEIRVQARLLDGMSQADQGADGGPVMALISVQDTGEGIAAEYLDEIFERFRQADNSSTRKAGGTGMGLAICRHLVNMHGGDIWVESTLGKGSTFSFTIPVVSVPMAG